MGEGMRHDEAIERIASPSELASLSSEVANLPGRFGNAVVLRQDGTDICHSDSKAANFTKKFHLDQDDR